MQNEECILQQWMAKKKYFLKRQLNQRIQTICELGSAWVKKKCDFNKQRFDNVRFENKILKNHS